MFRSTTLPFVLGLAAACAAPGGGEGGDLADLFGSDGKADIGRSAKLVDNIELNSEIKGEFDDRIRTYGYVFEAKRGANVVAALTALAGADADVARGEALDTVFTLYGPYKSAQEPGAKLASSEDGDTVAAPPLSYQIQEDGKYLLAFATWDYPGKGADYQIDLDCEGTDFQCRRPNWMRPCDPGIEYIQGDKIDGGNVTWDKCEVVLLESATVLEGTTLTIKPGVDVKGNYLGTGRFGTVVLTVEGTLQAAGTADNPVVFTGYTQDNGWGGIQLNGEGHTIEHAIIEKANTAISLNTGGAAIRDVLIEGWPVADGEAYESAAGVTATADAQATFERAVVTGFQFGLNLQNAQNIYVEDSVVRKNQIGVQVQGQGWNRASCGNPPAAPPRWRDPVFKHTDIIENKAQGIMMLGDDIVVQVEKSNIINNGAAAIRIQAANVSPESYIRDSNIYGNAGDGVQLESWHRQGNLDVTWNYWAAISDPHLSASWQYSCNGQAIPTGFSPEPIKDAGPRLTNVKPEVKEQCFVSHSQHAPLR